jgi:hypothetical protein
MAENRNGPRRFDQTNPISKPSAQATALQVTRCSPDQPERSHTRGIRQIFATSASKSRNSVEFFQHQRPRKGGTYSVAMANVNALESNTVPALHGGCGAASTERCKLRQTRFPIDRPSRPKIGAPNQ